MLFYRLLLCTAVCWVGAVFAHPGQHDQLLQLNRHIEQAPADQALFIQRGAVYSEGGQYQEALADYGRAQQLGPPVLVAFELGVLYYRMGDYERADDFLEQYLVRFPDFSPAYDYLARSARDAGDYDRAIANLQTYFRLQERPNPGLYLSAARMLEEEGRFSDALLILDQGMAALGIIPQLQRYAVRLEQARGQPALAIGRLETLRQMLGDSPDWKLEMAGLLLLVERREEAAAMAAIAQAQLEGLRSTPARIALQRQAAELLAGLEREPSTPVD